MDAKKPNWHGYKALGQALHIGPLPGRKRIALYVTTGGSLFPMAYFRDEEDARRVLRLLDLIANGETPE